MSVFRPVLRAVLACASDLSAKLTVTHGSIRLRITLNPDRNREEERPRGLLPRVFRTLEPRALPPPAVPQCCSTPVAMPGTVCAGYTQGIVGEAYTRAGQGRHTQGSTPGHVMTHYSGRRRRAL